MKTLGISEIGLAVSDLEASASLYRGVLGARLSTVTLGERDARWQVCRFSNVDLRLHELAAPCLGPGATTARGDRLSYIGLRVESVEEALEHLMREGLTRGDLAPREEGGTAYCFLDPVPFHGVTFKLVGGEPPLHFPDDPVASPDTRGPIDSLLHVGINVLEIGSAIARYAQALGVAHSVVFSRPLYGLRFAFLRTGNADLELLSPADNHGLLARSIRKMGEGIAHLCWAVADIDATLAWLRQHKCRLIDEQPQAVADFQAAFVHPEAFNGVLYELIEGKQDFFDPSAAQTF